MKRKKSGFTLIEMVIVLFIVSLLLLLIVPNLNSTKNMAEKDSNAAFVQTIQTKADMRMYELGKDGTGANKGELVENDFLEKDLTKQQAKRFHSLNLHIDTKGKITSPDGIGTSGKS
jgi:competence protein ComGC